MGAFLTVFFVITGLFCFGVIAFIYLNIKAGKEYRSNRLNYSTAAFACLLAVFGYYVYWLINADILRAYAAVILGPHALLLFVLVTFTSKHADKSYNFPSVLRASLVTFVLVHLLLPAFPKPTGMETELFVFFKLTSNITVSVICATSALFLLFINIILMFAMVIMFFRYRNEPSLDEIEFGHEKSTDKKNKTKK